MGELKPYKITGRISYNASPVSGAKIQIASTEVFSKPDGYFTISGEYTDIFNLIVYKDGFSTYITLPFDSKNNIKSNVGVIELSPLKSTLDQSIAQLQSLPPSSLKSIVASKTTFETFQQKKLNNILLTLQFTLLPIILKMIAEFGVSNIKQAISKNITSPNVCPTKEQLDKLLSRKNKLVKQLNTTYKVISAASTTSNITLGIITGLEAALTLSTVVPIPAPPGVSIAANKLDQQIKKYRNIVTSISITLNVIKEILSSILQYLSLLDQYVQHCYPDAEQERVSAELTSLTQQQSQQQSPVVTNVNGFEMGVETEDTTKSLKRRRAIAKNAQGIVMLKGEWSFSSIDQILIDELVFYIQQNDLKAY
jgi:hypothetical protein